MASGHERAEGDVCVIGKRDDTATTTGRDCLCINGKRSFADRLVARKKTFTETITARVERRD